MLAIFSIAANVLPYYSYGDRWKPLMNCLSLKTQNTFKTHKKEFSFLSRMHFGDREKLIRLIRKYKLNLERPIDTNTDLRFYIGKDKNERFFKKCRKLTLPKVRLICVAFEQLWKELPRFVSMVKSFLSHSLRFPMQSLEIIYSTYGKPVDRSLIKAIWRVSHLVTEDLFLQEIQLNAKDLKRVFESFPHLKKIRIRRWYLSKFKPSFKLDRDINYQIETIDMVHCYSIWGEDHHLREQPFIAIFKAIGRTNLKTTLKYFYCINSDRKFFRDLKKRHKLKWKVMPVMTVYYVTHCLGGHFFYLAQA